MQVHDRGDHRVERGQGPVTELVERDRLAAGGPDRDLDERFGRMVLTTNFDPLVQPAADDSSLASPSGPGGGPDTGMVRAPRMAWRTIAFTDSGPCRPLRCSKAI
jgi:hypothetical protein